MSAESHKSQNRSKYSPSASPVLKKIRIEPSKFNQISQSSKFTSQNFIGPARPKITSPVTKKESSLMKSKDSQLFTNGSKSSFTEKPKKLFSNMKRFEKI